MPNTTDPSPSLAALREATSAAARILTAPARRRAATNYLTQRGIDATALPEDWPLGYAPPGWTRLVDQLHAQGIGEQALLEAGFARRCSRGTLIDTFRDRVIFPVQDAGGAIAGFLGRDLSGAPNAPKYLNTAGTPLFTKGSLLYGLHEAAVTNPHATRPVLVEGPLDVLAITTRAIRTGDTDLLPVATSGTAVTATQTRLIAETANRHGVPVVVAMDGDTAGRTAALTAGEQLRRHGAEVKIAILPNGCDPTEHLTNPTATLDVFRQRTALPLLTAQLQRAVDAQGDRMQWVEGRLGAVRDMARYLAGYPPEQAITQTNGIATALDVAPSTFLTALATAYAKADALPPQNTCAGELLRAAARPSKTAAAIDREASFSPTPAVGLTR